MLSLFFPNIDALRLALATGIIPAPIARTEVSAATGHPGGLWVQAASILAKDSLAALAHIGVRSFACPADLPWTTFACWAAALPLKRDGDALASGPILFEVPAARLPYFLRELARCGTPVEGHRLLGDSVLVRLSEAPLYWVEQSRNEADSWIRSYRQAGPNFWVQSGWQHSLPSRDITSTVLVSEAAGWRFLEPAPWRTTREQFALRPAAPGLCSSDSLSSFELSIRLKPRTRDSSAESFWILPGSPASLGPFLESMDHRTPQHFEMASLWLSGGRECVALRCNPRRREFATWPGTGCAYHAHPQLERLMIPADRELTPGLRASALERAFGLRTSEIAWLEPDESGVRVNRFSTASFRLLSDSIRYEIPEGLKLNGATAPDSPFAWAGFVVLPEPAPLPIVKPPRFAVRRPEDPNDRTAVESARSRIAKWAAKLFAKTTFSPGAPDSESMEIDGATSPEAAPHRRVLTLQERSARRAELEESLFSPDVWATSERLAGHWADLAELYTESGNLTDAALCWLHALWRMPRPPEHWSLQWAKVEARLSSSPRSAAEEPIRQLRPVVVELIRIATRPSSQHPTPWSFDLRATSQELEAAEETLPCRMVWLARAALAHLSGGDVLLLARGRDRLFARLQNETALAALDTPSFLRFRGLAGGDRYSLARDWLVRCREPIHRWLKKQSKSNRLAWAGLDADVASTVAYADWMLAWGFAKLGDQIRATELTVAAARVLQAATGAGIEAGVHRELQDLFRAEIRAAFGSTRCENERPNATNRVTTELGDYAVAKLVAHSQILGRQRHRSEFGSRPLVALHGEDDLAEKLARLLDARLPIDESVLRPLLERAGQDRTAATLPRVILTLLEVVETPALAADILELCPRALELLPEALRLRGVQDSESFGYLIRLASRCVELVCKLAVRYTLPAGLRAVVGSLGQSLDSDDPPTVEIFRQTAARLFRTLSRCGLTAELRHLLGRWYRVAGDAGELNLSAAIGWFTLGETERGNRILNDARERIFVSGIAGDRDRTRTALAYAQALAHAPPRLALGRLEELFQRLGPITISGATARYYALKPLELVDAAITAIVNEDFSLGPEMRSWLDEDELRIRNRITRDLQAAMGEFRG